MSGGSYNYLYSCDHRHLIDREEDLNRMAARLTELGFHDVAGETEDILAEIASFNRRVGRRADRLSKVWKSVEWFDSADAGLGQVADEVETYRGRE